MTPESCVLPEWIVLQLGSDGSGLGTFPTALPEVVGVDQFPEFLFGSGEVVSAVPEADIVKTFYSCKLEQRTSKIVNNCFNTNIDSYFETSGGQINQYLNVVDFFNTRVN